MSDYSIPFSDKLLDDESFDTIFGGQEDDELMGCVMKEADEFNDDVRDTSGIEDGTGALGKGDGLGSDLGTDHASKGAEAPNADTSDQDVIAKDGGETLKQDQLNTGDNAQGGKKDGGMVKDFRVEGEDQKESDDDFGKTAAMSDDKVENIEGFKEADSFEEAYNALLKELEEEGLGADPADPAGVANPDSPASPVAVPPTVADSETPELPEEVPAVTPDAPAGDMVDALDLEDDEDDSIMDTLVGEEANVDDVAETRDNGAVEDKKEDNLGDDLGPDSSHESKGGDAPTDDTSDNAVIEKKDGEELKGDQLNSGDNAQGKVADGGMVKDFRPTGDCQGAADDSFGKQAPLKEGENCENCDKKEEKPEKEDSVKESFDDFLEAAVMGFEEASDDLDDIESEEDELIADAKKTSAKSEFSTAELNEDEDDDIMNAVMGGE